MCQTESPWKRMEDVQPGVGKLWSMCREPRPYIYNPSLPSHSNCILRAYYLQIQAYQTCPQAPNTSLPLFHNGTGLLMKHLGLPSFSKYPSALPQITLSLHQPPSPHTHPSGKKDWKDRFPQNVQSSKQDQPLRWFFTSQQLPSTECLCVCVCVFKGRVVSERGFILLSVGA